MSLCLYVNLIFSWYLIKFPNANCTYKLRLLPYVLKVGISWNLSEKISNPALQLNLEFDNLSLEEQSSLPEWISEPRNVGSGALIWEARHFVLTSILPWLTLEAGKCQYSKRSSWKTRPWTEKEIHVWQSELCRITYLEGHAHHACLGALWQTESTAPRLPYLETPTPFLSRACSMQDALLTGQGVGLKFPS